MYGSSRREEALISLGADHSAIIQSLLTSAATFLKQALSRNDAVGNHEKHELHESWTGSRAVLVEGIADYWLVRHFSKTTRPSRSNIFVCLVYFVVRLTASLRHRLQTRHGSGEWRASVRKARARSALDRVDIRRLDAKGRGMRAAHRFAGRFSPPGWQFYGTRVGQGW
jgi:hypothetical protein